jgi:uncharacterized membrane protein YdfJ with MMPL/SSD domain
MDTRVESGSTTSQDVTREHVGLVVTGWNVLEVLGSAVRGLVTIGLVLGTMLIWLIIFVPVWATMLSIIYWRWRRRGKRLSNHQSIAMGQGEAGS